MNRRNAVKQLLTEYLKNNLTNLGVIFWFVINYGLIYYFIGSWLLSNAPVLPLVGVAPTHVLIGGLSLLAMVLELSGLYVIVSALETLFEAFEKMETRYSELRRQRPN